MGVRDEASDRKRGHSPTLVSASSNRLKNSSFLRAFDFGSSSSTSSIAATIRLSGESVPSSTFLRAHVFHGSRLTISSSANRTNPKTNNTVHADKPC